MKVIPKIKKNNKEIKVTFTMLGTDWNSALIEIYTLSLKNSRAYF